MKIYKDNFSLPKDLKLIFTLGVFDGVHLGHQYILRYLKEIAEKENGETAVMTFSPHPRFVLQSDTDFRLLTTLEEKIKLFEKFSVENLFIQTFSKEFSQLTSTEFVRDILVKKLHINSLIIGYDHQFGKDRNSNFEKLQDLSINLGFKLYKLPSVSENDTVISSTKIREMIIKGNIEEANKYLGYHFILTGKIIEGDKIGRKLGFPTANLEIDEHKIHPANGVYFVKVKIRDTYFYGMMNIGMRPTINGLKKQIEVHILNFDENIYGENIEVYFYSRERDEIKFSSLDELKNRLKIDKEKTKAYFDL